MPWENPGAVFYDTLEDTNQKASDLTKENDSDGEYFECSDCDGESEYDFVNSLVDDKKRGNFSSYLPKDSLSSQSASSIHAAYNRCPKQPSLTDTLVRLIDRGDFAQLGHSILESAAACFVFGAQRAACCCRVPLL